MTLDKLSPGQRCRIVSIKGNSSLKNRFLALGLTPGTVIFVRKTAPLHDPLEICLRGYELALRREEAGYIQVQEVTEWQ